MGIDLDQAKGSVAAQPGKRPERAQAGRMFAAQQHGQALFQKGKTKKGSTQPLLFIMILK